MQAIYTGVGRHLGQSPGTCTLRVPCFVANIILSCTQLRKYGLYTDTSGVAEVDTYI